MRASAYGDTAASAAVKKYGGNCRLARRLDWVSDGLMAQETEIKISSCIMLCDIVLYSGPLVVAVGRGRVSFFGAVACVCRDRLVFIIAVTVRSSNGVRHVVVHPRRWYLHRCHLCRWGYVHLCSL